MVTGRFLCFLIVQVGFSLFQVGFSWCRVSFHGFSWFQGGFHGFSWCQVGFCIFHVESTLKLYSGPTIQSRHHGASLTEGIVAI